MNLRNKLSTLVYLNTDSLRLIIGEQLPNHFKKMYISRLLTLAENYSSKGYSNLDHRNVSFKIVFKFYVEMTFRREDIWNYFTIGHFCYRRYY